MKSSHRVAESGSVAHANFLPHCSCGFASRSPTRCAACTLPLDDVHVQDVVAEPVKDADGPRKLRFPQLEDVIDNFPLTSVSGTNGSIMNIFLIRSDVRASFDAFPKRILIFQLTGSPLSLCFS